MLLESFCNITLKRNSQYKLKYYPFVDRYCSSVHIYGVWVFILFRFPFFCFEISVDL